MISKDQWYLLKTTEQYGMYCALEKRLTAIEEKLNHHTKLSDYCPHTNY